MSAVFVLNLLVLYFITEMSIGISKIENLDRQTQLKYLQQNLISKIENLDSLKELDTLNLENNCIKEICNLKACSQLNTLNLAKNQLKSAEDINVNIKLKSVLDLSNNSLENPNILDILKQMPNLKVLYLFGNKVCGEIKNYRKTIISSIATLTHLDDRPVFEEERRTCNAWAQGGLEAERGERERISQEKKQKEERNFQAFKELVRQARQHKKDPVGPATGATFFDDATHQFDDEMKSMEEISETASSDF
ncbi:hypothetical protein RFI_23664 [Reticulomyxa filosa]|uniref:Dynein assembly factor 1, axonemal homolog n=1 Tax=Reticulomyxa filosa TaxID=46433 RepID=X6MIJ3_RETFI|nr:hypothetical protein RFI_23664 [Reticulomyxa filosa]|eukprot:ETO13704.1 hypothetical protein RFI_23664 [Reticulomyxa filosa]